MLLFIAMSVKSRVFNPLAAPPLRAQVLHLCIGDTWNTVTNIERRLGVSALGCVAVWASVLRAIATFRTACPAAGLVLAPSGVWISVACVLTSAIWRLNEPVQPLWPVRGDGKSAPTKLRFLGQLQATSIGGRIGE